MSRTEQPNDVQGVYFLTNSLNEKSQPIIKHGNLVNVDLENDVFTIKDKDGFDRRYTTKSWGRIVFEKLEQAEKVRQKIPLVGTKVWCVDTKALKVTLEVVSGYHLPFMLLANDKKIDISEIDQTVFTGKTKALSKLDYLKKR